MTREELEAIEARCNAATPGPWEWDVNSVSKIVHLRTVHSGRYYVMGFKRFGTKGAAPTFQVYEKHEGPLQERGSKGMFRADDLAKSYPGKEHHEGYDDYIDHPDAEFIAHSKQDVASLIAEVKRLTRERDALFIDLKEGTVCDYCIHANSYNDPPCQECSSKNDHWQWRGVQEGDNEDA